jgi:lipopolysaccharide biosynthesis regulator YciM
LVFSLCQAAIFSHAQLGFSFDIPKPKQYEERQLRSEKTEQKKFTIPRRFIQNTTTHYNYFYNATNKLNEIITRAKEAHTDDFTELLSFYNYDLDVTVQDSVQLDSVIYKATSGIVLHDLRSDWADNMYLLWGAAHYLQKEFDSAYLTFQFINYAFAPKEKDGYYQFIGSRMDGNSAISVSTKEKKSLTKKIFTRPPSRNDAFIWQIRTFLAWEQYPEAASLIATLKADPIFPNRLQNDLEEVQALYFYKQAAWDSAAFHLSNALSNATGKQERARWEFLTGQLYELAGNYGLAQHYYEKSVGHTVDPVMAVYARLNSIRVDKTGGENFIEKNIAELIKMAKHDRYSDYRDIIYYMAAQMELERNNIGGAQQLLLKATKYDNGNVGLRNKAYLKLAELALANKDYRQAYNFYDSLRLNDPELKDIEAITKKKEMLGKIAMQTEIWERRDSLQRIAAMPEDQRKEFVKKILKELRKKEGLKDIDSKSAGPVTIPTDIFSTQASKGEWYFYNAASKTRGAADFKAKWGSRPNVDNWRRMQAVSNQKNTVRPTTPDPTIPSKGQQTGPPEELTYENLYNKLPLTEEQLKVSNDSIQNAMFELGKIYANEIEDCGQVVSTFEALKTRYPQFSKMDEVLFHLYYCYNKTGDVAKAAQVKSEMGSKYSGSDFTTIVTTGKDPRSKGNTEATKTYETIYDLFIEGRFDEAVSMKQIADSSYGENYWTPQLLYIESVYNIKQRNDSTAISGLQKIQAKYPNTPLAEKATTMIDVLGRRKQIEEELNNWQIKNPQPEEKKPVDTVVTRPLVKADSTVIKKPAINQIKTDSVAKKYAAPIIPFAFNAETPHYVVIILNKVDQVFGNEAKNAFARYNREKFYNKTFELNTIPLDAENKLLLIQPFANAQAAADYVQQVRPKAASEIIPWLKADKYSFSIISAANLEILKSNPDLPAYKRFLDQNLPGKF